jgi:hypothetical protein
MERKMPRAANDGQRQGDERRGSVDVKVGPGGVDVDVEGKRRDRDE